MFFLKKKPVLLLIILASILAHDLFSQEFPPEISGNSSLCRYYNLAVKEAKANISDLNQFYSAEIWYGIHTRDIGIAAWQSLSMLFPQTTLATIESRIASGEIIQDAETGGGWPVSNDRIFMIPAIEKYLQSNPKSVRRVFLIEAAKQSLEHDYQIVFDLDHGLFRGESTYLNWREETYPDWADPRLILESYSSSNNLLHLLAIESLIRMLRNEKDREDEKALWNQRAVDLAKAIRSQLFLDDRNFYSAYLIPEAGNQADFTDNLANIFAVLSDTMNQPELIYSIPLVPRGVPSIYPQKSLKQKPQHNHGIVPFVTAFYIDACRKTGYRAGIQFGMQSLLQIVDDHGSFVTTVVADSGSRHTALSSDRQLWSIAAWFSAFYSGYLGLSIDQNKISFAPDFQMQEGESFKLSSFTMGEATFTIEAVSLPVNEGFLLNGRQVSSLPEFSLDEKGSYSITCFMPSSSHKKSNKNEATSENTLTSEVSYNVVPESGLKWVDPLLEIPDPVKGFFFQMKGDAVELIWMQEQRFDRYAVLKSGSVISIQEKSGYLDLFPFVDELSPAYSVMGIDYSGLYSLPVKPALVFKEMIKYPISKAVHTGRRALFGGAKIRSDDQVQFQVEIKNSGKRTIDFYYNNVSLNPSGCIIRKVKVDGVFAGFVYFPRTGFGQYLISTRLPVWMDAGFHSIELFWDKECRVENSRDNGFILRTMSLF